MGKFLPMTCKPHWCVTWRCKLLPKLVHFQVKFKSHQCQLELVATLPSPLSFSSNQCAIFPGLLLFSYDQCTKFPSGLLFIVASTHQKFCLFYLVYVYLQLPHVPLIVMAFFLCLGSFHLWLLACNLPQFPPTCISLPCLCKWPTPSMPITMG